MKHRFTTIFVCSLLLIVSACSHRSQQSEMDRFIDDLMAQLTLEEKLGQLNLPVGGDITTGQPRLSNTADDIRAGKVGGLFNLKGVDQIREVQRIAVEESPHGIPLLFGMDVIHGYETIFPIPLGLACSWDMDAIERSARIAAIEAGADGICWTFSPMVDICHDGRWGRISEGSGEDPYLGACIAQAMVRGYQGDSLADPTTIMACVKHFALYGAPEGGREYNFSDMSAYRMWNEYMLPYQAAAQAQAGSFMAAFSTIQGVPCHGSKYLLTDILRRQWGYQGFVVADYTGVEHLVDNGVSASREQAAIQCIEAGLDMDMVSAEFVNLAQAVKEGRCSIEAVNRACRSILVAKYKLGLFDDPYRYCDPTRREVVLSDAHRAAAREIAAESMVLLKNENNLLPLAKQGTIALIGPLAQARTHMSGTWSVAAVHDRYKTVEEGLRDALKTTKTRLLVAKGCNICYDPEMEARASMFGKSIRDNRSDEAMRQEALAIAQQADVIILAMGESAEMSGECASRVNLDMPDAQHDLMVQLTTLGKPIVLLHFAGRPTVLNWESEHIHAILETWFSGSETADAIADVLFGATNPSGKLVVQLPRHVGQYPFSYRMYRTSRPNEYGYWGKYSSCYMDVLGTPLYAFGYGLSYTTFDYSDLTVESCGSDKSDKSDAVIANVSVTVTNTGDRAGAEIVQLYICDPVANGVRPYKELRGFERIYLEAGESKEVTFAIDYNRLAYYEPKHFDYVVESGDFIVMIGSSSRNEDLRKATITVTNLFSLGKK